MRAGSGGAAASEAGVGPPSIRVRVACGARNCAEIARDGLAAGVVAALLSGLPSTLDALVRRADPLESATAAGSLLLPSERRTGPLLVAAAAVHLTLSLGWALALAWVLPRRATIASGVTGGLVIAALDLGLVGRRYPRIRALRVPPQIADHVAFGAVVGAVVRRRRDRRQSAATKELAIPHRAL